MSFIKVTENFICENCGFKVSGSGYTNHCPNCLYSKHVDEAFPGDRKSNCLGLMIPVSLKLVGGQPSKIKFTCKKCQKNIYNKVSSEDSISILTSLLIE